MSWTHAACVVLTAFLAGGCRQGEQRHHDSRITFYRLRAPGNLGDIDQASDLHWGRLGDREGLWLVCDRNGGDSAGRLFFISASTLRRAEHGGAIVADEAFTVALPDGEWASFVADHASVPKQVLAHVRERIRSGLSRDGGPLLDLEGVTIAPSPTSPETPRMFVVAEEPHSVVLELELPEVGGGALAKLKAVYAYHEADDEHGTDFNDGLEGLAWSGRPGEFYWVEEGTRSHDGAGSARLFFLNPRLGRAVPRDGKVNVDQAASQALTTSVWSQRVGDMQTLNAVTVTADGRLLVVDRNGGWILRVDPADGRAVRWLNLYDLRGTDLRQALARFPAERRMPYISIEGIAVDDEATLWLVDDPAMPEGFRASCLVRVSGLDLPAGR